MVQAGVVLPTLTSNPHLAICDAKVSCNGGKYSLATHLLLLHFFQEERSNQVPSGLLPKHMRRESKHTGIDWEGHGDTTLTWPSRKDVLPSFQEPVSRRSAAISPSRHCLT